MRSTTAMPRPGDGLLPLPSGGTGPGGLGETGQSTPEYALVIVLVATVVVALIPVAREALTRLFKAVIDHVVELF